jgi:hypothetical protein
VDVEKKEAQANFEQEPTQNHQESLNTHKGVNQQIGPNEHQQNDGLIPHSGVDPQSE